MTVPVQETRFPHTGNGVTVEFAYGCQIQSPSDLVISLGGIVVTSGFTVSGVGAATGGSVAFNVAPADGIEVLLERIIKLERTTDYQQNGDFLSRVVNPDFDRIWMALQQFESILGLQPGAIPRALMLGRNDTNGAGSYRALQNRIQDLADPIDQQDGVNLRTLLTKIAEFAEDGTGQAILQLLAAPSGAALVGDGDKTVQERLQEHDAALENIDGNLNFETLPNASTPVADADLMILRQGTANKKIDAGTFRTEFATEAVAAAQGAVTAQTGAETARNDAQNARDAAQLAAGVHLSTALGLAATTSGQFFNVISPEPTESLILYRNNAGTADEIKRYPSVLGYTDLRPNSLADAVRNRIVLPAGGVFNGGPADTTGAFKIKLPVGLSPRKIVLDVTIADNYGLLHLRIAGDNNNDAWYYTAATVTGSHQFQPQPSVRWGNDGTGHCIWIGDTAVNFWAYPKVWINRVSMSGTPETGAATNWQISLVTAFDSVTVGPITPEGNKVRTPFLAGGTYAGYQAGQKATGNSTYNTLYGYQCGAEITTGYNNTFVGMQTGPVCTTGYGNTGCGLQVLQTLTTGAFNSAYGIHALIALTTGVANTAVGGGAMEFISTGSDNTAIGMYAGRDVGTGSRNVFIGNRAGQGKVDVNDKVFIANNPDTTLIEGDFAANRVWVGGGADDGVNTHQVEGPIRFKPATASTPQNIGDLTFEATSDTSLKIKFKGSDGVVRSAILPLA